MALLSNLHHIGRLIMTTTTTKDSLGHLFDSILEGLCPDHAAQFPILWLHVRPRVADPSRVAMELMHWALEDAEDDGLCALAQGDSGNEILYRSAATMLALHLEGESAHDEEWIELCAEAVNNDCMTIAYVAAGMGEWKNPPAFAAALHCAIGRIKGLDDDVDYAEFLWFQLATKLTELLERAAS